MVLGGRKGVRFGPESFASRSQGRGVSSAVSSAVNSAVLDRWFPGDMSRLSSSRDAQRQGAISNCRLAGAPQSLDV